MHVSVAAGRFEGRTKFEISHRPSGESGQGNYTTGLRWGSWMTHILMNEIDCTGRTLQIIRFEDEIQIKFFSHPILKERVRIGLCPWIEVFLIASFDQFFIDESGENIFESHFSGNNFDVA